MSEGTNESPLEGRITREQVFQCEQQGRLFEMAFDRRYDMRVFANAFMNSRAAVGLDADFDRYQWAGNEYILGDVSDRHGLSPVRLPNGEPGEPEDGADREACHWMGYTYRWWNYQTGEASRDIYRIADYDAMLRAYPGFHTLSCSMAVDRLRSVSGGPRSVAAASSGGPRSVAAASSGGPRSVAAADDTEVVPPAVLKVP